jgi:hypothetical protein
MACASASRTVCLAQSVMVEATEHAGVSGIPEWRAGINNATFEGVRSGIYCNRDILKALESVGDYLNLSERPRV